MNYIYRILFPEGHKGKSFSLLVLAFRLLFGLLLMSHGIQKWAQFDTLSTSFPNPFGLGSEFTLILAIFAELFCSMAFIFGFLYRLVLLPMTITMGVAFFQIHGGNISQGELAFVYLAVFVILYISGPGRFSIDRIIFRSITQKTTV